MRYFGWTLLWLLLMNGSSFSQELGAARVSLITGDVQINTVDTEDWVAASINLPLQEEDRLWVPEEARTELHLQGEGYIRLDADSSLDILTLRQNALRFFLNGGHAYINNLQGGDEQIRVDTQLVSIVSFDNAQVMIDVDENGATEITVLKGYASSETRKSSTWIEAGETLRIDSDLSQETSPLAPPTEWEEWNRARDEELAERSASLRHLPPQLYDYGYEFDAYGSWVSVSGYGYCWRPLRVSVDWSPYRIGRWCWLGGDYIWISYEPWGWAPHHYGRWTFVVNLGWCWVPPSAREVYWGPGYVGWVNTPAYVAWVPLAPGEIYYGRRYYGPWSKKVDSFERMAPRYHKNSGVNDAVTVVRRDDFVSGRDEPVRFKGDPYRGADANFGPPVFAKPDKQLSRPISKTIRPERLPPERLKHKPAAEFKRGRAPMDESQRAVTRPERRRFEDPVRKDAPQREMRRPVPLPPATGPAREPVTAPRRERTLETVRPEQPPAKVRPEQAPARVRSEQPPARVRSEQAPAKVRSEQAPARVRSEQPPARVRSEHPPAKVRSEQPPARVRSEQPPAKVRSEQPPARSTPAPAAEEELRKYDAEGVKQVPAGNRQQGHRPEGNRQSQSPKGAPLEEEQPQNEGRGRWR